MDTIISDVPALDDGMPRHGSCKLLQVYIGLGSELLSGYPMASESKFPSMLQDFICDYGTMRPQVR